MISRINNKKVIWLIRRHPRQADSIVQIDKFLKSHSINNFNIVESTELPLLDVIELSTHHLTNYSTTAYESAFFKKPVGIFGKQGHESFSDEFDDGIFHRITSPNDIVDFISKKFFSVGIDNLFTNSADSATSTILNKK